jgi:hypothetical protein
MVGLPRGHAGLPCGTLCFPVSTLYCRDDYGNNKSQAAKDQKCPKAFPKSRSRLHDIETRRSGRRRVKGKGTLPEPELAAPAERRASSTPTVMLHTPAPTSGDPRIAKFIPALPG